jgi:hypothetical protein
MMLGGVSKKLTAFGVALSMTAAPAFAAASAVPAQGEISPLVALSIFGSQASAAALCGSSATAATASAAVTAQAPAGGCVLPLVDAPPPPLPMAEAPPLPPPHGFGISPVLLGLAGIAILAALIASQGHDHHHNPPVSVN